MLTQATDGDTKKFSFKAMRPGIYVYHCASPHIPTHIANGMYGMILVEPKAGLPKVDREYYIMQGEFYTTGKNGEKGLQGFSKDKMDMEHPEYVVFNGRVGSLTGDRALKAKTGETVRVFFGVGTFLPSNFHVIGGIPDRLYPEGDIVSPPHRNVQTTLVPAGGAAMMEMKLEVPGKFLLVDHALPRAVDKGALGELVVEGADRPDIIRTIK
jgi:nitrite reductase (NO-forming)